MPEARGSKRIPLSRATNLPWLKAPAGYVVVIEDVELGDRFKIITMQEVSRRSLARVTDLAFETELFLLLSAANAEALALELHDRFAASGDINEWFDLDRAQVAQLRDFGRPAAPSLRDLALSAVEGQSLVEKSRIVSAAPKAPPRQARGAPPRPQRRWASWLLLLAIVTLGASVLGNAPQLHRLLGGRTSLQAMLAPGEVLASATAEPSPSRAGRAATSTPSPRAVAGADDVFYVLARANARVCASRECRAVVILEAGTRIAAQWYESGQPIDGNSAWIAYRRGDAILYVHSSALSQDRWAVDAAERPSATSTLKATVSASPTHTLEATNTIASAAAASPTDTREPSATATEPTATARPTETTLPTATATSASTATATDVVPVLYVDTANNLNARVRACPSTDCDILGRLRPGAEVRPTAEVAGEVINGIAAWIAFEYDGRLAYIHGELVSERS